VVGMKVAFVAESNTIALNKGKIYDVISVEKGWYRILCELDDDFFSHQRPLK
jgi:hypothetical protein